MSISRNYTMHEIETAVRDELTRLIFSNKSDVLNDLIVIQSQYADQDVGKLDIKIQACFSQYPWNIELFHAEVDDELNLVLNFFLDVSYQDKNIDDIYIVSIADDHFECTPLPQ